MPNQLGADHWRKRAAEARSVADQIDDDELRWRMLRIASDYEKMADNLAATSEQVKRTV